MPDILFKCGTCEKQLVVDEAGAGNQVKCPKCDSSLIIPKTAIVYSCLKCGKEVKIDTALKGEVLHCPGCEKPILLPVRRADQIVLLCWHCDKIIMAPISEAGKSFPCPNCYVPINMPNLNEIADGSPTLEELPRPTTDNTKKCQYCEKTINAKAVVCPFCHFHLRALNPPARRFQNSNSNPSNVSSGANIDSELMDVKVLLVIGVGALLYMSGLFPIAGIGLVIIGIIRLIKR